MQVLESSNVTLQQQTLDEIVLLQEYLSESALTTWIILQVEFVKSMKGAFISMNIQ